MCSFRIVPVPKKEAIKIKKSGYDELGNPVIQEIASGLGPCRVSLKPFKPGEDKRLLFSYSPFSIKNVYRQFGPIYTQANNIEEYSDIYRFPPELKADKKNFPLTLVGYDINQMMIFSKRVGDKDVDQIIENIFDKHLDIEFLHARNSSACCYICKIKRI